MNAKNASILLKDDQRRKKLLQPDFISGSEILLRSLLLEGVDCVFGYPGGSLLYIYDAMFGNKDFRHLLTRHEQGAIHAADGYARSTGKVGVCIATSGPGATNLVTGIATANMDSVPLVVITGNVPTSLIGTDSFQEADIIGITMPITKHSFQVQKVEELAKAIHEAFHIASTGRKGPVLIDIPKDVTAAETTFTYPGEIDLPGYQLPTLPNKRAIEKLLQAIKEAEKPVIIAGAGVIHSDAHAELLEFVNKTNIPITTTLMGLGGFPSDHPLWLGMPGMHGTYTANTAIQQCDLLISLGARFDDRVTMNLTGFAPHAKKIAHIDIDPAEIGKNVQTHISCVGDIKSVLSLANQNAKSAQSEEWIIQIQENQRKFPLKYEDNDKKLMPQYVIEMIHQTTNGEAIITTDVGQHQMWVAQFYKFSRPKSLITSGGLGTMGFGFPSAIGAQVGNPDRLVISINGDGGIQMCSQELAVCALHNLPIKVVIINNQVLGMIRQWQEFIYDERYHEIDLSKSPDFIQLARSYGVKGLRAESKEEAHRVWQEALETPGPVVVEFMVPKDEVVLPMVLQGNTLDEMILKGKNKQ